VGTSDSRDSAATPVLQKIVPIVLLIGTLGVMVSWLTKGADPIIFLQVGAAGALFVYFLTFVDIILGLAILIGCVGLSPEISMGGLDHLRLEDFLVPALLLAWLLRAGQARLPLVPAGFQGPAIIYILALAISSILGVAMGTTTPGDALELVGKYLEYFAIYLLIVNNVRTEQEFKALVLFSVLVAISSAIVASGSFYADPIPGAVKVRGPLGETANIYGGYLILHLGIVIGLFIQSQSAGARVAASAAVVFLGIALLHTYSRTSTIALGASLLAFGLFRERRVLLVVIVLVVLVLLVAPDSVVTHLSTVAGLATGSAPSSFDARVLAWEDAFPKVMSSNPLLGMGPGSVRRGDIDSEYVRALVDSGVLGLGLFAWILFRIGRIAFVRYGTLPGPGFHKGFAGGFLIAFGAMCVHGVAATSFTAIRTMEAFMIFSGLYFCQVHHYAEWTSPPVLPPVVLLPPRPVGVLPGR
jgi:O-antigen ligase/polysaccharide polymerase Wzy-like membrane protein